MWRRTPLSATSVENCIAYLSGVSYYSHNMSSSDITIKVRRSTHEKIARLAIEYRVPMVEAIDILIDAWPLLPPTKQLKAIRMGAKKENQRGAEPRSGG